MTTANLLAALLIGLTSSAHCVFMCGGIAASLKAHKDQPSPSVWLLSLLFHLGRLFSYALIGGLLGFAVNSVNEVINIGDWLRIFAGLLLIGMGTYLANIWRGLSSLERLMEPVWHPISKRLKKHIPARTARDALIVGLFWGWLPCGLIYSTLAWASSSSSNSAEAALLMFTMGLGTVPVLLGISFFSQFARSLLAVRLSGLLLCLFGLWTLAIPAMSVVASFSDTGASLHDQHKSHHNH